MPKGVRYTPEQREEMKEQAQILRAQGKPQKEIAERLGVAIPTLKSLLGDSAPVKGGGRGKAKVIEPAVNISNNHPAIQLAVKKQRLAEIETKMDSLQQEKQKIQDEMQEIYKALGQEIFG